jgi:hypothetical protein
MNVNYGVAHHESNEKPHFVENFDNIENGLTSLTLFFLCISFFYISDLLVLSDLGRARPSPAAQREYRLVGSPSHAQVQ